MMTIEKCKKLLVDRVAHNKHADKHPDGALKDYHKGLRLEVGDLVHPSGWTPREVAAAPPGTKEERLQAMYAHWFPQWDGQDIERDKKRAQAAAEKEDEARRQLWVKYGPPPRYADMEIEDMEIESETQRLALDKVLEFPARGAEDGTGGLFDVLAILGPPGTRKTQLAASWLRREIFNDHDGHFVSAAQLLRDARNEDAVARYCTIDTLVIDDIGADPKDVEIVLRVVDARLNNKLTTVYTANASPKQLNDVYGPRGFSRLMCNAQVLLMGGRDWRQPKP